MIFHFSDGEAIQQRKATVMGKEKHDGKLPHATALHNKRARTKSGQTERDFETDTANAQEWVSPLSDRLSQARMLRARATCPQDLHEVQSMLESILQESCTEKSEEWMDAGMFLATLLLQQDESMEHDKAMRVSQLLQERGFCYRLSRQALMQSHKTTPSSTAPPSHYACAWDNVLPLPLLQALLQAFSQKSCFWSSHEYSDGSSMGKPPSPYFSYIVPLLPKHTDNTVFLQILCILQAHLESNFPAVRDCEAAEWWCHCRPRASGHQLHFDSDDEGRGGVRNPIVSSVLSLTEGVGGETLVTTQTATDSTLCDNNTAWLSEGKVNRLVAFRGNLLHGVVPAGGSDVSHSSGRRITFMVAFWKSIRVQDKVGPGSARPMSRVENTEWAKPLMKKGAKDYTTASLQPTLAKDCFFEVPLWQDVNEEENVKRGESLRQVRNQKILPSYDDFFQFYT